VRNQLNQRHTLSSCRRSGGKEPMSVPERKPVLLIS
jgi:hypothetical protein